MAKKNAGLGRGLEAIFLDNQTPENEADKENRISKLRISLVDPKSDQPRKYFDKDALEELAASITEKVKYVVTDSTGITVNKVNVKVDGIKE